MKSYSAYIFNLYNTLVRARGRGDDESGLPAEAGLLTGGTLSCGLAVCSAVSPGELAAMRRNGVRRMVWRPGAAGQGELEAFGGVLHILRILRKHGKFVGLYSTRDGDFLGRCLRGPLARARECVDFALSAVEARLPIGSPQIVAAMQLKYRQLRGKAVGCQEILMVGDALADLETAQRAGVDFAGVLTGNATESDFVRAGLDPAMVFPRITEALRPPADHGVVALIRNERNEYLLVEEGRSGHPCHGCWSGPHGVCEDQDVVEEETVAREAHEECGVAVRPIRRVDEAEADTRVRTVSFWEAELVDDRIVPRADGHEVSRAAWIPLEKIVAGKLRLYEGTRRFFAQLEEGRRSDGSPT